MLKRLFKKYPILSSGIATILLFPLAIITVHTAYTLLKWKNRLSMVYWDEQREITLDDFEIRAHRPGLEEYRNFTGFGLTDEYDTETTQAIAFFNPNEVFINNKATIDIEKFLAYINLDFDLNELYTRRVNYKLEQARKNNNLTKEMIRKICNEQEAMYLRSYNASKQILNEYGLEEFANLQKEVNQKLEKNSNLYFEIIFKKRTYPSE